MHPITTQDRFRGCLLGLAAGDALGTTLEFRSPGTFRPIEDMTGGGPFGLRAGQWTDDTSMALCLAASLIETGGFDPGGPDASLRALAGRGVHVLDGTLLRHRQHRVGRAQAVRRHGRRLRRVDRPVVGGQRLLDAAGAGADALRRRRRGSSGAVRGQLPHHARGGRGGGRVPLLRGSAGRRAERRGLVHAAFGRLLPGRWSLAEKRARREAWQPWPTARSRCVSLRR